MDVVLDYNDIGSIRSNNTKTVVVDMAGSHEVNVRIDYEAISRLLRVYYPATEKEPIMVSQVDLGSFSSTLGKAWVGFVGEEGSGVLTGSEFHVSKFNFSNAALDLKFSMIEEQNTVHSLLNGELYLDTRTSCATPLRTGGLTFNNVELRRRIQTGEDPTESSWTVAVSQVTDLGSGRYKFDYVGCVEEDLTGWFESCEDYAGKYDVYVEEMLVGSVRMIVPE